LNVFDCMFSRRSTRGFRKDPVDDKMIGVMLYCATHSPSAGNNQEWVFVVVRDRVQKKRLAEAALQQGFISEAPVVIVVGFDKDKSSLHYGKRGETLYAIQDTAAATMSMLLAAEALGLKTCWVGAFDEEAVGHIVELPKEIRPVAIIPVGYSDEVPQKPRRVPFENLTHIETYGRKYEVAYSVQPDSGKEYRFKPLGNYLEEFVRQNIEERESQIKKNGQDANQSGAKQKAPGEKSKCDGCYYGNASKSPFDDMIRGLRQKKADDEEEEHF
jgi:nitroreductase